jgi:AAA+ superfamily predicted ATPase
MTGTAVNHCTFVDEAPRIGWYALALCICSKRPIFTDAAFARITEGGETQEVGEMNRVVINLLQNIDMFPQHSFLIAATNHGQLLDSAIWRRFTVVNMELPTPDLRQKLIEYYAKGMPIQIDISQWVQETDGLSGAEIKAKIHTEAKRCILNSQQLNLCGADAS